MTPLPPGAIERIIAGCASLGKVLTCWQGGLVLTEPASVDRTIALVEMVVEGAGGQAPRRVHVELEVRGTCDVTGLWRLLQPMVGVARLVLDDFPALRCTQWLKCPECRRQGRIAAPRMWDLEKDSPHHATLLATCRPGMAIDATDPVEGDAQKAQDARAHATRTWCVRTAVFASALGARLWPLPCGECEG